jgi:hypothetical protein
MIASDEPAETVTLLPMTTDRKMTSRCAACGAEFHCGLADSAGCWCAQLPALQAERYDPSAGCLCEACLRNRLAAGTTVAGTR